MVITIEERLDRITNVVKEHHKILMEFNKALKIIITDLLKHTEMIGIIANTIRVKLYEMEDNPEEDKDLNNSFYV